MIDIEFSSVSKTYNSGLFKKNVRAVSDFSLGIQQGEVFGLIGPNGAGKSTTIRLLLGLIRPDAGDILYRGRPIREASLQKDMGYLPESPYLYDHLTLDELLSFCGRVSGLSFSVIEKRGGELMDKLAITGARNRALRTFSKGMLQRAGICFALLHDPAVVILDEPMSGLDPVGRRMVFELVMDLREQGKTVFFCSHILNDVERLCDRIGIMNKGRLLHVVDRGSIVSNDDEIIHLLVEALNDAQHIALKPLLGSVREIRDTSILSFPAANLSSVAARLESLGVKILGSREERLSLEDYFMQVVEADQ
ncbi:ABC transporter ATP-binding protein [Syntrophotalea acetylenica]|uniref:ABC transporter ATP-binding protein n=1 Tax=Syntrophotalea acetylenica TaxID=29542 RepID=UPI002A35A1D5|nr:ABC transporter ATP-binding protein [Syntrophotalea acetylenica]MDY0262692.1 ABC transporter ATP-binding protein [Syntrophotalea acetylenica]